MEIKQLKSRARQILPANAPHLTLMHTAIALGASLLVTVISFLLSRQLNNTGGLAGIGSRSLLTTAQTVLTTGITLLLPFWNLGYTYTALGFSRGEPGNPADLAEGFRRFRPAFRMLLLRTLLTVGIVFACLQVASILFILSPLSNRTMEMMDQLLAQTDPTQLQDPAVMEALAMTMLPAYLLSGALFLAVGVPLLYRFRLTDFAIMDKATGGRDAFRVSLTAMKNRRLAFFRLDLSFWWYYLLQAAAAMVAYGDFLLPINGDVAFFLCCGASLAAQLLITWRFAPQIQTTYATAYRELTFDS